MNRSPLGRGAAEDEGEGLPASRGSFALPAGFAAQLFAIGSIAAFLLPIAGKRPPGPLLTGRLGWRISLSPEVRSWPDRSTDSVLCYGRRG